METYVESFTDSLTHPQFSEQRFLEDMDYDQTALEDVIHNAPRVTSLRPSWRTSTTRSTTSSWNVIEAILGSSLKLMRNVSMKWKNSKSLVEDHNTILELEKQEYKNCQKETYCMNDSKKFSHVLCF